MREACKELLNTECGGVCEPIGDDPPIVTYKIVKTALWDCPKCGISNADMLDDPNDEQSFCKNCDTIVNLHTRVGKFGELKEIKCCDPEW